MDDNPQSAPPSTTRVAFAVYAFPHTLYAAHLWCAALSRESIGVNQRKTTTMDHTQRPAGNFTANPRRYATAGKPQYTAKLVLPGTDLMFTAGLFSNEYDHTDTKTSAVQTLKVLGGNADLISPKMTQHEQAATVAAQNDPAKVVTFGRNNKELRPGQVVLFEKADEYKKPKDGKTTKPAEWYGYWNYNGQLVEIGAWNHQDKQGYFFIGGKTQFPLAREMGDDSDFRATDAELDEMARSMAPEESARGDRKRGARSSR